MKLGKFRRSHICQIIPWARSEKIYKLSWVYGSSWNSQAPGNTHLVYSGFPSHIPLGGAVSADHSIRMRIDPG